MGFLLALVSQQEWSAFATWSVVMPLHKNLALQINLLM